MNCKRRKLDSSSHLPKDKMDVTCIGTSSKQEDGLENWQLRPVLDVDITDHRVPLIDVYVDKVSDPKQTSRLIQDLNTICPIPSLQHLKRVSKCGIILSLAGEDTAEMCVQKLRDQGLDTQGLNCEPHIVQVSAVAPRTRAQYQEAIKLWPCNFHEDKYLEKILSGKLFSDSQKLEQQNYMKISLEAARRSVGCGGAGVGAVVVDPEKKKVIAVGYDNRGKNHLQHAVMVVVDLVAHFQDGGAWNLGDDQWFLGTVESTKTKTREKLLLDIRNAEVNVTKRKPLPSRDVEGPIELKRIKRYSSSEINHRQEASRQESKDLKYDKQIFFKDSPDSPDDSEKRGIVGGSDPGTTGTPKMGPYLCTGYDVYVTREPCTMCAMALVHSRVRRLFYGCSSSEGALGTKVKIHTLKALNHHYEVFAGILENECKNVQSVKSKE
ncbi:probable inactive tRNA-specific adenosine deaminase-like protein 3 [Periplaneta americana]|uniref:probable inactive tRNA-specific adenosine deaminase-like protein 3 n=1 Tax=Periplaneta americana TaxID=6978 RepID=UPI0037E7E5CC